MTPPYVLNARNSRRLQALGKSLICHRCRQPLMIGETVINKGKQAKSQRLYHLGCYEDTFANFPDEENEEEKHEHEILEEEPQKTT
jgi:RNase P subunit RPR2